MLISRKISSCHEEASSEGFPREALYIFGYHLHIDFEEVWQNKIVQNEHGHRVGYCSRNEASIKKSSWFHSIHVHAKSNIPHILF
jgi:hypothetical protein